MLAAEVCMGLCKKHVGVLVGAGLCTESVCGSEFDLHHVIPIPVLLHLSKLSNDIKAKSPKNKAENLSFTPETKLSYICYDSIYIMIGE